jgi:hypothetical protein
MCEVCDELRSKGNLCEFHYEMIKEPIKKEYIEKAKAEAVRKAVFAFEMVPVLREMVRTNYRPWSVEYFVDENGYTCANIRNVDFEKLDSLLEAATLYLKYEPNENARIWWDFSILFVEASVGCYCGGPTSCSVQEYIWNFVSTTKEERESPLLKIERDYAIKLSQEERDWLQAPIPIDKAFFLHNEWHFGPFTDLEEVLNAAIQWKLSESVDNGFDWAKLLETFGLEAFKKYVFEVAENKL